MPDPVHDLNPSICIMNRYLYARVVGLIKWSRFAILPPCSLCQLTPTFKLHSTLPWHVVTFCTYCYNCNGDYQYRQVNATVWSRNITFILNLVDVWHYYTFQDHNIVYEFFLENHILWILCDGIRNFEPLTHDDTLRNTASNVITQFVWVIFQEQKTIIIIGKQCYKNDG
jgi:hypothetical protein